MTTWGRAAIWVQQQISFGSFVIGGLVVIYGAATLADTKQVPAHFWEPRHTGASLIVILGVAAGIGSFLVALTTGRLVRATEAERKLAEACREVAWLIETNTSIPHGEVGVHAWQIVGPPLLRRLRRRTTFRTTGHRQLPIVWRRGKGVLGACWLSNTQDELADIDELQRLAPDEETFCALALADRYGMTWEEFNMSRHYKAIWVTKLFVGAEGAQKLRGFLSIDVEASGRAEELRRAINENQKALRQLLDLCETVFRDLRRITVA